MTTARVVLTRHQLLALALMLERGACWSELSGVVQRDARSARATILRALERSARAPERGGSLGSARPRRAA
jgi:hypothetical protein